MAKLETSGAEDMVTNAVETVQSSESPTKGALESKWMDHGHLASSPAQDDPNNPRNWSYASKVYLAVFVSSLAFMSQLGASLINPSFVEMSKELKVSVVQVSYCATVYIITSAITPMFLVPFANLYGRRHMFLIFILIMTASQVGSGAAKTYTGILIGRAFYGIGGSVALGIGTAVICDLFTQSERGLFMGIFTLCTNIGPHMAPIIGGYIALRLSWRWCFYIPAIVSAAMWLVMLFTFWETLWIPPHDGQQKSKESYLAKLVFYGKILDQPLRARDFIAPYRMARYVAVVIPSIYWMTANTYGSAQFAVSGSYLAIELYHFNVAQTGLLMGLPLTIGNLIGEVASGWVSDRILAMYASRHNGYRKPEVRLVLLPGCLTLVAAVIAFGPCVQDHRPWITLAICMGIAGFGGQVGSTMVYTYTTDCYTPQSAEIGAIVNLFKSALAFTIGFYALPFGEKHGFNVSYPVLGAINGATLIPVALLWFYGERIRKWQGLPTAYQRDVQS